MPSWSGAPQLGQLPSGRAAEVLPTPRIRVQYSAVAGHHPDSPSWELSVQLRSGNGATVDSYVLELPSHSR